MLAFFYKDMPVDRDFYRPRRAIALNIKLSEISLKDGLDGDENYYFRAGQPITAAHFNDVPKSNPYFKYIETLYDYSTQSAKPFFNYEVRSYLNYWWGSPSLQGPPVYAYPDHPVSGKQALEIISGLLQKPISGSEINDSILTRGEAALLVYHILSK